MEEYVTDLNPGDVVRLKSGGHLMSVGRFYWDKKEWECTWSHDGDIKSDQFPETMLRIIRRGTEE